MVQNNFSISTIRILSVCHVFLITISNVLVQYPFSILGFHTTWGAFSYPAIFILTDLTTRFFNANIARKIVFRSMVPGLVISYIIVSYIDVVSTQSWSGLFVFHPMPLRIALACFIAYTVGQLLDILVFQRYRNNFSWYLAPALSTTVGNCVDTILFFTIAFYHSSNLFLSQHWLEVAEVDMVIKIAISLMAFVPIYGFVLNMFNINMLKKESL